ncbi:hypothetical protein KR074_000600 [Drosophila pseudoananassae]|nr:hypothetical protein KR074_000600 [Drosophila pseudoananassae]
MTPSPAGPSQRPSQRVNRQREEATAARHEKVQTPVFAPLYQTPPTTSQGSSIPFQEIAPIFQQVVAPTNWMTEVFGVKCMPFLDDCCISFGCNHEMDTVGEVQRRLLRMDDSALQQIYVLSTRSVVIFKNFFISFAEIFLRRNLSPQVLRMISDCRLYKSVAGRLIANIFGILKQRGMENEMTRVLMRDLWMPSTAIKFRDLTISILHVLSKTNWEDYLDQIIRLGSEFKFPIPSEIIIHILKSDRNNNPDVKSATTKLMLCIPVKDLKNPQLVEYLKILAEGGAPTDNIYFNQNYNQHANALDVRPRTSAAPSTCVTPRRTRWNGPGSNNSPMPGYSMNPITPRSAGPSPGQNSTPNRWMGPQGGGWMGN